MRIILKENVESLGKAGDILKVADGYARNYLIPKGLALEASTKNVSVLDHEKTRILKKADQEKKKAQTMAEMISGITCTITRRIGEQDKLFGSVGPKDIEKSLIEQGVELERKSIHLPEPIKALGEFPVKIKLSGGVVAELIVIVVPEE